MNPEVEGACARAEAAFAAGRWFEAHEHWEDAWRRLPQGVERTRVQGRIHLAVALHQHARGNPRGAANQLEKARRKLTDDADGLARWETVRQIVLRGA